MPTASDIITRSRVFLSFPMARCFSQPSGFIILSIFIAAITRGRFLMDRSNPINDGGFWQVLAHQLSVDGLELPKFLSFNGESLPVLYPPLGAYVVAIVHMMTGVDERNLLLFLPVALSFLTVIAFCFFAVRMMPIPEASIAIALFPLLPLGWRWGVMGGGISRSLGLLFFFLSVGAFVGSSNARWRTVISGLVAGAAALSHPVAGLATALAVVAVTVEKPLLRQRWLLFALSALTLCVPWLLHVLGTHGFTPFIHAFMQQTGSVDDFLWCFSPYGLSGGSPVLFLLAVPGLVSLVLASPRFPLLLFLLMTLVAPFAFSVMFLAVPAVFFSSRGLLCIGRYAPTAATAIKALLLPLLFAQSLKVGGLVQSQSLSDAEYEELAQFSVHPPLKKGVMVLSRHFISGDAVGEWTATLTNLRVTNVHQLKEWSGMFQSMLDQGKAVERCCSVSNDDACKEVLSSAAYFLRHKPSCTINPADWNLNFPCKSVKAGQFFELLECGHFAP